MAYPNAVATTAQGLFTIILAALTIMLSSCDGGSGGGGENNLLKPDKISITGSISDSLKSTFDPVSNNYELYSRYIGSAKPTAADAKATDVTVTDEDIQGTIVVLAVDQDYNVYTTNTDSARKFKLAIPPNKSYVIIFVNITGKQVGVLVHQEALVTASYQLVKDVNLGEVAIIKTCQAQAKSAEKELQDDYDEEKTKDAPKNVDEIKISDKSNQTLFLLSYLALPTGSYSYVVKQGTNNYQHLIKYYKQVEFKGKKYLAEVIVKMCETPTEAYDSQACSQSSEIQNMYLNEFTSEVVKTAYIFDSNIYHRLSESRELPLSGKIGEEVKSTQDRIKYRVRIEDVENKSYGGIGTIASVSLRVIATGDDGNKISDQRYWYAKNIGLIQQENPNGNILPQEGKTIYVYNTDKSEGYGSKPDWFTDNALASINNRLEEDLTSAVSASNEMKISYAGKNTKLQEIKSYINKDHRLEIAFRTNSTTYDSKGTVRLVLRNFATNNEFKAALDGNSSLALKWAYALEVYDGSSWQKCVYDSTKHFFEVSWGNKNYQFSISPNNTSTFSCDGKTLVFDTKDGAYLGTYTTKSPLTAAPSDSRPAKPMNLVAKKGDGEVDLTWGVNSDLSLDYYDIFYVYYHSSSDISPDNFMAKVRFDPGTRSATITDLTNNTRYYFVVTAIKNGVESLASNKADATPKAIIPAPTKLKATGKNKAIDLSWNAITGATNYTVYYHTASFDNTYDSGVKRTKDITADNTSTSITNLKNGTKYYLRVAAISATDNYLSEIVTATANLQAPTGLIAISGQSVIDITWDAVFGATRYKVYFHTAFFDETSDSGDRGPVDATTDSTRIQDVKDGTKYYLRVEAINAEEETKLSEEIVTVTTKPDRPRDLVATGKYKAIDLSWNAVTGADSYTVYHHTDSFDSTTVSVAKSTTGITAANTSITDLASGATYYFRVIAINPSGSSVLSEIRSATTSTLTAPKNPKAAASIISPAAVDLSWDGVAGVTNYKIYYAKKSISILGGNVNLPNSGGGSDTTTGVSITIGDLSADTTYYFVVAANYVGGNGKEVAAPEVSADSSYIAELAMSGYHSCVRLNTGRIKCWGWNEHGELGVDDTTDRYTATSVDLLAKQLSAGVGHSCAIDLRDKLYCWGDNGNYELGLSGGDRYSPTLVTQDKLASVSLVTAGSSTTCALAAGNNYCWGNQGYGGLGNGVSSGDITMTAQKINDITPDVQQFTLGEYSGCAIDASGDLWCWGLNNRGQVGDDTTTDRASPVKPTLQGSSKATMLDGTASHYCVVDDAKKIQCWGQNHSGELGINSKINSTSPQYVLASTSKSDHLEGVSKIATGDAHSCALIAGGRVRCWGWGEDGIIGTDATADRLVADTDMPDIYDAIDITAGWYHTCVLLADRTRVKCWGANYEGQLGNDKTADSYTPVEVKGL